MKGQKQNMDLKRNAARVLIVLLSFGLSISQPLAFAYSSKEAKEKVESAERVLLEAQRAAERANRAADDLSKKRGAAFQDALDRNKKAEEARAAREKADETGKESDIKAAEKAEKIAAAARKKSEESEKALGAATQALEAAESSVTAAKEKVGPAIEEAEKAVDGLPETSVKKKLKERIQKVKDSLKELALAPGAPVPYATLDPQKVSAEIVGTKETIGHVATLTLTNHTNEAFFIEIPPTVLESKSGERQDYGFPNRHQFTLGPGETRAFPLTGVCLKPRVPPAGPEDKDELRILDPTAPGFETQWRPLLVGTQATIQTAARLQAEGAYTTPYSKNPKRELDTIIQWATWLFVSTREGNPVTKADLAKKVYEQTGEIPQEKKAKMDEGIEDLWDAIQLTGEKAKPLSEGAEKISGTEIQASPGDTLEDLKKKEHDLEEEYKKAMEEFEKAKEALEEANKKKERGTEIDVTGGIIIGGTRPARKKFETRDELEKAFLDALEKVRHLEAELQKAALEREAAEKEKKKTEVRKPAVQPPVVIPPPAGGVIVVEQPENPPQGPCGFFEKKLLRTVETEWRPKGGRDFALPGRDPAVIVVWEKDIENEFQVTGHCPLPAGHGGDHTPVEIVYEKVKTITQEESYPPGTRRPKPPKGLGLPIKGKS